MQHKLKPALNFSPQNQVRTKIIFHTADLGRAKNSFILKAEGPPPLGSFVHYI